MMGENRIGKRPSVRNRGSTVEIEVRVIHYHIPAFSLEVVSQNDGGVKFVISASGRKL